MTEIKTNVDGPHINLKIETFQNTNTAQILYFQTFQQTTYIMVVDMSYHTVDNVISTWELIRRIPDFKKVVGVQLFQKLFILEPEIQLVFGIPKSLDPRSDEILQNQRFVKHAQYFIEMIDNALGMLGPDIELLTEIMVELGKKHGKYGVKPEYFPIMGRALLQTIAENLREDQFTEAIRADWLEIYSALSYDMIRARKLVK